MSGSRDPLLSNFMNVKYAVTFSNLDTNCKNWGRKISLLRESHITTNWFFELFMVKRTFCRIQLRMSCPRRQTIGSALPTTKLQRMGQSFRAMLCNLSLSPPLSPRTFAYLMGLASELMSWGTGVVGDGVWDTKHSILQLSLLLSSS